MALRSYLFATALFALVNSCVSKGDTEIAVDDDKQEVDGNLCARFCENIEEQCGDFPNCEAECTNNSDTCPDEALLFLECAVRRPVGCDAVGDPYVAGCDDEGEAYNRCIGSDGECETVETWESCDPECCESGSICIETAESAADGPVCMGFCDENTDCPSGCCRNTQGGARVCGFPADCAPVAVGDPCLSDADCASELCLWGGCVAPCASEGDDCGQNFLERSNVCTQLGEDDDGTELHGCLPGCSSKEECDKYYQREGEAELDCVMLDDVDPFCY